MCLIGIESRSPGPSSAPNGPLKSSATSPTWRQMKRSPSFGSSAPGSRPASQRTWKPLQMPSTGAALGGEACDRLHRRREARDRSGAQVVAVGEAAGDDHAVEVREVRLLVPDQPASPTRLHASSASRSSQEPGNWMTPITARARPRSPRSAGWRAASRRARRASLGSSVSSSTSRPTRTSCDALEAERRQRPLDRLALRVEDALLRAGSGPSPSQSQRTGVPGINRVALAARPQITRPVIRS